MSWLALAACGASASPSEDAGVDLAEDAATRVLDAGAVGDEDAGAEASRCDVSEASVRCDVRTTMLSDGTAERAVYWQAPVGSAPPTGFPVALIFQGSLFGPSLTWGEITPAAPFGGFHQGLLQAELLDSGFVVIAPEAAGGVAWSTNVADYEASADKVLVLALLEAIAGGQFGPADMGRLYATGISSGGYMTSRMAVSHAGVFAALAIQSGSYATCLGPICNLPAELPADHPPTLFLHGEQDAIVPIGTVRAYYDALRVQGVETELVADPVAGHAWLAVAPARITEWFEMHRRRAQ